MSSFVVAGGVVSVLRVVVLPVRVGLVDGGDVVKGKKLRQTRGITLMKLSFEISS